jgi:hypothetical protein
MTGTLAESIEVFGCEIAKLLILGLAGKSDA